MKLSSKILALALILVTVIFIGVKVYFEVYFTPTVDKYIEESVEQNMFMEMKAFERIIITVVNAAEGNSEYVKQALERIHKDKNIPIELRRSELVNKQFQKEVNYNGPINESEKNVFKTGKGIFRKTDQYFEYIYPLNSQKICQACHRDTNGEPVQIGYTLGLAVKKISRKAFQNVSQKNNSGPLNKSISRELSLAYFVMDLFWPTLILLIVPVIVILIFIYLWVFFPLSKIEKKFQTAFDENLLNEEDFQPGKKDFNFIEQFFDHFLKKKKSK